MIMSVENLSMVFGGLRAVDDVSFHVNKGEVVALIGPNGAGKTTVFNCVLDCMSQLMGTFLYMIMRMSQNISCEV